MHVQLLRSNHFIALLYMVYGALFAYSSVKSRHRSTLHPWLIGSRLASCFPIVTEEFTSFIQNEVYSTEKVHTSANFIKGKISKFSPKIGIICGSGLGGIAELVAQKIILSYKEIPSFVESTVPGHKGQLVVGKLNGKDVICMQGRFHPYEGYAAWVVGFPIRVMKLLGVEIVIITNAAGGINQAFSVGDFMIIKDHISFPGLGGYNPLRGPNDDSFGPRFPPMNDAYDQKLRDLLKECAKEEKVDKHLQEGVYCNVAGPVYETIAELRMLKILGGDAVGMSTAQEVVTARHCGLKVLACSLITNKCILDYDTNLTVCHEEVLETGKQRAKAMESLISAVVKKITV